MVKAVLAAAFIYFFSLLIFTSSWAKQNSKEAAQAKIYLTIAERYERPITTEKSSFHCEDRIFAVAELDHFPPGKHEFSVRWIDPSNATREHTRYPFYVHDSTTRLWSWLRLQRGSGASLFQWLDSSLGMEEFIGQWTVKIQVDGKSLGQLNMDVNC